MRLWVFITIYLLVLSLSAKENPYEKRFLKNANCDQTKTPQQCGNNNTQESQCEQCDDGNNVNGDGCSDKCWREVCGNGAYQPNANYTEQTISNTIFKDRAQYLSTVNLIGRHCYLSYLMFIEAICLWSEECDNGNLPGCIDCTIDDGWDCPEVADGGLTVCTEICGDNLIVGS